MTNIDKQPYEDAPEILDEREHFYWANNPIVDDYDLSHTAFRVYHVLARYSYNRKQDVKLSMKFLCGVAKMSDKTWTKAIEELSGHNLVKVFTEKRPGGTWERNVYRMLKVAGRKNSDVEAGRKNSDEQVVKTPTAGRKISDGHVVKSPINKTSKINNTNKNINKVKESTLFNLPTKQKPVTLEDKVELAVKTGTMLGLVDFRKYYGSLHREVLGGEPGGKPTNDSATAAVSALINNWGIPQESLVAFLPLLFKRYKEVSDFPRLSFYMLHTQLNNKSIAQAVDLAKADMRRGTVQTDTGKYEQVEDLEF